MNGKRFSKEKRRGGFYLALAVCLTAVGIAAWSTYDSVTSYTAPQSSQQETADPEDPEARKKPSQEEETSKASPSAAEPSPAPTPKPAEEESSQAQEAAGEPSPTQEPAREEPSQAESSGEETVTPQETQVPANAPLYEISAKFIWPVASRQVSQAYSAGAPVYSQTMKDWRIHTGTDLSAQAGEEVLACANGQVLETATDPLLGNLVTIEHGDFVFSYCGLGEDFAVSPGDTVAQGQVIGTVTAVPQESAESPHLHLEVRRDQVCLDPQSLLEGTWQ
ncbi:MAG TPA: peptidoglycan DD-metalloendopeptidase family protein [Candidatus Acutalibacter pullistercoris]|uniref:Peptidoglycan DD-metalloendopeptidase family protein n=1 Tax=Candidatus Acutalibacter pullistercoris TaxID=2838418 RepID=A0A9D1YDJ3_9FIRM|nr:peptidoglycan DD-metalloendopeptidase family protein [Candidatus Acutalibacter pullistercoris]